MRAYASEKAEQLGGRGLRGFVFKKDSPSCGVERVRLYDRSEVPSKDGVGLFAEALMKRCPLLPVEEEGRLQDPRLRENFIMRIFAYDRWIELREGSSNAGDVAEFHAAHKLLLLAHSSSVYNLLEKLIARAGVLPIHELLDRYETGFMTALRCIASPGCHANVLEHLACTLKEELDARGKEELHGVIRDYRAGCVPLITPVVLLHHQLNRLGHRWVEAEVYLEPYPRQLALRCSI